MKTLVVNGESFQYPENRDSAGWGEDAAAWSGAVTDALSNISGTGDILQTTANIANNQASAADVVGLQFDPSAVRGAIVEYSVYRVTTSAGAQEKVEAGTMYVTYKSTAALWEIAVVGSSGAGTTFTIQSSGQIQYSSDNMTGSTYSGVIKFRARALTI